MIRRPPRATRTDTLFPYTTLFRARLGRPDAVAGLARELEPGEVVQAVVPVRLEHLRDLAVQQRRAVTEGALGVVPAIRLVDLSDLGLPVAERLVHGAFLLFWVEVPGPVAGRAPVGICTVAVSRALGRAHVWTPG